MSKKARKEVRLKNWQIYKNGEVYERIDRRSFEYAISHKKYLESEYPDDVWDVKTAAWD